MGSIIKKRFDIQVTEADKVFSGSFELDKDISFIRGILLTSNKDDLMYYRGSQKIEINKQEIVPEGYESKLLMCGINVSPNVRYYETGHTAVGNGQVKLEYRDTTDSRAPFEAYRVSIYLNCELKEA